MLCYQFNLTIDGKCYIRGDKTGEHKDFFIIKNPIFYGCSPFTNDINIYNNTIKLSKNIVCYYFKFTNN